LGKQRCKRIAIVRVSGHQISKSRQCVTEKRFLPQNGEFSGRLVRLPVLLLDLPEVENIFVQQFYEMEKTNAFPGKTIIIIIVAMALLVAGFVSATRGQGTSKMPSLGGATGWLNSQPLTLSALHGEVVLIDFWTYTCINWRRTLPYISAWAAKYKEQGLVVIGVHTPEFSFEHNAGNISEAAKEMEIDYPIAIDDNYAIWNAFGNEYWPALYFIDAQGRIRHHQFGEGNYQESEKVIQQLLTDAGAKGVGTGLVTVDAGGVEAPADWGNLQSGENYVGYGRTANFSSPGGAVPDRPGEYVAPAKLALNQWAVSGDWTMGTEATVLNKPGGRLLYCFHARDLQLVMGLSATGAPVRFRVLIDGGVPGADHGVDIDSQGNGTLTEPRMYQLIRQQGAIIDRLFEIEFLDPGAATFSFTFG
jgi:thiol-disulfide isomerase/thioredoxin